MPQAAPYGSPVSHTMSAGAALAAMGALPAMSLGAASAFGGGLIGGAGLGQGGGVSLGGGDGIVVAQSPNVFVNALRAGSVTNPVSCHAGEAVLTGSDSVFVNGLPAARIGDTTTGGAVIINGSPNVIIGGGSTTAPDFAGADLAAQVAALLAAAATGKPFCAQCQAAPAGG